MIILTHIILKGRENKMGRIKDLIPENYSCVHYLDVEECVECMYAMQTAHIPEWRRPSIRTWYNKKVKK